MTATLDSDHLGGTDTDRLEVQIQSRLGSRVSSLRLQAVGHGLVIHGQATTYYAKQLAQHFLMDASPRPVVENLIEGK